jgi:hypothetical protein
VCVVSSVLRNGLHINTLISRCRETWAGDGWHALGGGAWLGIRGQHWTFKGTIYVLCCWSARDGRFNGDCSLGGVGYVCLCPPSPSLDRSSRAQNARKKRWLGPGLLMFYAVGAHVMGVSMVIAACGEGVNVCLCPPSSSSDRTSLAQNECKKRWLGGPSDTPPLATCVPAPPAPNQLEKNRNTLADLLVFPYIPVRQYSLIGYIIGLIFKYG